MNYTIKHHQIIKSALNNFNADFFREHEIFFGGGTRIALEIDEYRESIDIDFLCKDKESYRAVRVETSSHSLGNLVLNEFVYDREIRFDRDAVRTFINVDGTSIKVEFVSCDNYTLSSISDELFPVPYLDRDSCFYTKLLANSDRFLKPPYKDIFDILAMYDRWGDITDNSMRMAASHYGEKNIIEALNKSLIDIISYNEKYKEQANKMLINDTISNRLIEHSAPSLLEKISKKSS